MWILRHSSSVTKQDTCRRQWDSGVLRAEETTTRGIASRADIASILLVLPRPLPLLASYSRTSGPSIKRPVIYRQLKCLPRFSLYLPVIVNLSFNILSSSTHLWLYRLVRRFSFSIKEVTV